MERWGLIAMHQIQGVGWRTIHKLIEAGWSSEDRVPSDVLSLLPSKTQQAIRGTWSPSYIQNVKQKLLHSQIHTLTYYDGNYPPLLKQIAQPPWVLYARGDIGLLQEDYLGMVGTRKPTTYGRMVTRKLVSPLVQSGWGIVSGMANGIDGEAHWAALREKGRTIAVLGSGIDVVYPKNHHSLYRTLIQQGLVISEMPPGTKPHPGLFPQRNRIISGLSKGVIVIEAGERSGSLITADFCLEEGKEVFAVPGPITSTMSHGTLHLIQQGAKCVRHVEDIWQELPESKNKSSLLSKDDSQLTDMEQRLLETIGHEPIQITTLMERLFDVMTVGQFHQNLWSLEMKKKICQLPGSHYIKNQ